MTVPFIEKLSLVFYSLSIVSISLFTTTLTHHCTYISPLIIIIVCQSENQVHSILHAFFHAPKIGCGISKRDFCRSKKKSLPGTFYSIIILFDFSSIIIIS
jgi:hypothetical protein